MAVAWSLPACARIVVRGGILLLLARRPERLAGLLGSILPPLIPPPAEAHPAADSHDSGEHHAEDQEADARDHAIACSSSRAGQR